MEEFYRGMPEELSFVLRSIQEYEDKARDLEEMLRISPILDHPAAAVEELRGLKEELKTLAGNMGKKLAENMMSQQRVSVIVFFPLPDMQVFLRQGEELMSKICRLSRGMRGQERA